MHASGARNTFIGSFAIMVVGVWLQLISMRDFRRQAVLERRHGALALEEAD
jgi:hypothetical protein